ncbi:MAG: low molecular weight phosphotyrosine protein phosphatase [bacterium]|nr:low molecular weight phosphotyrosine protein phosphatase [bacterium]
MREEKSQKIKVLMICHGNICRSTMSEMVLKHLVRERGLTNLFYIDSAATSREEIGNGVHYGTRRKLAEVGIPCEDHRARQVTKKDYEEFDYLIVMDTNNVRNLNRIIGSDPDGKVYKLLDFTQRQGTSIADPWYTGDFDETYRDVLEGCEGFLKYLSENGNLY